MTFKRKKSTLYLNLFLAIAFFCIYLVVQFENESFKLFQFITYLLISIWYTIFTIYIFRTPQISITNEAITHYQFPKKTIAIVAIESTSYRAGDFIIRSKSGKKIRITKSELHEDDVVDFEKAFAALGNYEAEIGTKSACI